MVLKHIPSPASRISNPVVKAVKDDAVEVNFEVIARLDKDMAVYYSKHGGILPYVVRKLMDQ